MSRRTLWLGRALNFVADEPMLVSLIKYRQSKDRVRLECRCPELTRQFAQTYQSGRSMVWPRPRVDGRGPEIPEEHHYKCPVSRANLISSKLENGRHKPILDLDFPHRYVTSTRTEHAHLYLDVELPWWRWVVLMVGLRVGGVTESGFMWWSLRRGANFVRPEGVEKTRDEWIRSEEPPRYGLVRRLRSK